MSKLYNRARSPSPLSHISKRPYSPKNSSSLSYDSPPKSYRTYNKFGDNVDDYDRNRYDKLSKSKLDDKYSKSAYKIYSSKDYDGDNYSSTARKKSNVYPEKSSSSSYREVSLPYKSKNSSYGDDGYTGKGSYLSKYPLDKDSRYSDYSVPVSRNLDGSEKYNDRHISSKTTTDRKRYSPNSTSDSYSKYHSDPYYSNDAMYDSYDKDNYTSSKNRSSDTNYKDYPRNSPSAELYGNYERYVIGDSVVYGSPGHYPKDICSKNRFNTPSPPPQPSGSKSSYRKKSSPNSRQRDYRRTPPPTSSSLYSSRPLTPLKRPPSPPPQRNYRSTSPSNYSKGDRLNNYNPIHSDRNKNNRRHLSNERDRNRREKDYPNVYREKRGSSPYAKNSSYRDLPKNGASRHRPLSSPKPLLSIPLTLSNVPRDSRRNIRETLDSRDDKGVRNRFKGRIGPSGSNLSRNRKGPLSPKERKGRRPGDLRQWIESRKIEGNRRLSPSRRKTIPNKTFSKDSGKGKILNKGIVRDSQSSRLLESRKRILNKGKTKNSLLLKRKIIKKGVRRLLPVKSRAREDRRSKDRDKESKMENRDKTKAGEVERRLKKDRIKREDKNSVSKRRSKDRVPNKVIKRPRVVSGPNSLPIKPRKRPRTPDKDDKKTSHKNFKTHSKSKRTNDKARSTSRSRGARTPESNTRRHSPKREKEKIRD